MKFLSFGKMMTQSKSKQRDYLTLNSSALRTVSTVDILKVPLAQVQAHSFTNTKVVNTMGSISMTIQRVMVNCFIRMEIVTQDTSKKQKHMAMVSMFIRMDHTKKEIG
jgi:hypothetical protein